MNNDKITDRYYKDPAVRERIHWMVGQCEGERVLDIGCSQGIASILAAREGFHVVGIDIEEEAIRRAEEELAKESEIVRERVRFHLVDAGELGSDVLSEMNISEFDTVLLGEVLEHQAQPKRTILAIDKVLNKNGKVVTTVPLGYHPFYDHKWFFGPYSLMDLFAECGFTWVSLALENNYIYGVFASYVFGLPVDVHKLESNNDRFAEPFLQLETSYIDLQREHCRKEHQLKERIAKLEEDRERLRERVEEFKERIAEFRGAFQEFQNQIAELRKITKR